MFREKKFPLEGGAAAVGAAKHVAQLTCTPLSNRLDESI